VNAVNGGTTSPSTVQFMGEAVDQSSVAGFLTAMEALDVLDRVWLSSSTKSENSNEPVTFAASAVLTEAAASDLSERIGAEK
jgi:hypothetical protein